MLRRESIQERFLGQVKGAVLKPLFASLALQQILLAGCPAVGLRRGAPFVRDGVTGYVVERLAPGQSCVESDAHPTFLATHLGSIQRSRELDRRLVYQQATVDFDSRQIVDAVLHALEAAQVLNPGTARRSNLARTAVY